MSVWQAVVARRARADALSQRDRARDAESDATAQRDRAEKNFRRARDAVDQMLTDASEKALAEIPQAEPIRRALLEKAAAFYRDFLIEHEADAALRYQSAQAYSRLARVEGDLGHFPQATQAYERQIALLQELLKRDTERVDYVRDLVWAHHRLGMQRRASGDLAEALVEAGLAVETSEKLVDRFPNDPSDRKALARTLDHRGALLREAGKVAEAHATFQRSVEIHEQLLGEIPASFSRTDFAGALNNLGILTATQGKHSEAVALFERAILMERDAQKTDAKNPEHRRLLRNLYENMSITLKISGKRELALAAASEIISLGQALVEDYPARSVRAHSLAESYYTLGTLYPAGREKEAELSFLRAIALEEKLAAEFPNVPSYQIVIAESSMKLGNLWKNTSRTGDALIAYRRAWERHRARSGQSGEHFRLSLATRRRGQPSGLVSGHVPRSETS